MIGIRISLVVGQGESVSANVDLKMEFHIYFPLGKEEASRFAQDKEESRAQS
jgi:hypothetical protein